MKIRILGLVVGASALAIWGAGCEQPPIDCRALHGSFAAKYSLVSGDPACSDLVGDPSRFVIGIQSYAARLSGEGNPLPDTSHYLLAIRTEDQATLAGEASDFGDETTLISSKLQATADFTSTEPNSDDVCPVEGSITTEVSVNAIPPNAEEEYEGREATSTTYEWKNIRILATPANPGNLMEAELVYTNNGCTATYNVIAIAPVIDCMGEDDMGNPIPDDALCDDQPDPKYGIGFGSGISPDVNPKCDKDLGVCVATKTDLIPGGP